MTIHYKIRKTVNPIHEVGKWGKGVKSGLLTYCSWRWCMCFCAKEVVKGKGGACCRRVTQHKKGRMRW